MLHWRAGKEHLPTQTLNKKKTAIATGSRAVYWRKLKGHASRITVNKQSLRG
jgi:hypothetical protein